MVKWMCPKCETPNLNNIANCTSCNQRVNSETWTCSKCSFHFNAQFLDKCDQCNFPRYPDSVNNVPVPSPSPNPAPIPSPIVNPIPNHIAELPDWECPVCTLVNAGANNICAACEEQKPQTVVVSRNNGETTNRDTDIHGAAGGSSINNNDQQRTLISGDWACPRCTLLNSGTKQACTACMFYRSSMDTGENPQSGDNLRRCNLCSKRIEGESDLCPACAHSQWGQRLMEVNPSSTLSFGRLHSIMEREVEQQEEKEANTLLIRIVDWCNKTKEKFVDDSFIPSPKSLFFNEISTSNQVSQWKRPEDIIPIASNPQQRWRLCDSPKTEDIKQGVLGNCWLMSALAVIAERPELINRILMQKIINDSGVYQVRLCKEGIWSVVTIDDLLPCNRSGNLVYSQALRGQLWVPLIEKAAAKIFKCYEALSSGHCVEGLVLLTGSPCTTINLISLKQEDVIDPDYIWGQLLSAQEAKFMFCASCGGGSSNSPAETFNRVGLQNQHAYSILNLEAVPDVNARLVQLKNPWANASWTGDWSARSDKWDTLTPEVRQRLLPPAQSRESGVFWMDMKDLLKYFYSVDICHLHPGWRERRIAGELPLPNKDFSFILLRVDVTTQAEFVLYQEKSRAVDTLQVDLSLVVLEGDIRQGIGKVAAFAKRRVAGFVVCDSVLGPGTYSVVSLSFWSWQPANLVREGVKSVVAIHTAQTVRVAKEIAEEILLTDVVISLARFAGDRHQNRTSITTYYLMKKWSGLILVVENKDPSQYMHIKSSCNGSNNIVCTRTGQGGNEHLIVYDSIPPLHSQIIVVHTHFVGLAAFAVKHHMEHKSTSEKALGDWSPQDPQAEHIPHILYKIHHSRENANFLSNP